MERDKLTRREEEYLFDAVIKSFLEDKIDLEIHPLGFSVKERNNPDAKEIFFQFDRLEGGSVGHREE